MTRLDALAPGADPAAAGPTGPTGAERAVERALARKREKYAAEVDRLIAATFQAMQDNDTIDPTVADILAEAQLSTTALYRHFPTKDDLLLALLEHAGATTSSYLAHLLAPEDDPVDRIRAWMRGMCNLVRTDELVAVNRPVLLSHPRLVERFPAEIAQNTEALVAPLVAAIADARAAAGRAAGDAHADALLTHRLIYGVITDRAAQRRPIDPAEVDAVVAYAIRALVG